MSKKKKKRTNPNRQPVTMANVNRAKDEARDEAIKMCWSIFFTVLRDKRGYTLEDLQETWGQVEYLSESVKEGRCTVADLRHILGEEEGIALED